MCARQQLLVIVLLFSLVSLSREAQGRSHITDADGDGYYDCTGRRGCDCNDGDATIYPRALEYCDGIDHDCDGQVNEAGSVDATTWYADSDRDGYGNVSSTRRRCSVPLGYVADNTDCDDTTASINPSASEVCDSLDNDCSGTVDDVVFASETDSGTPYLVDHFNDCDLDSSKWDTLHGSPTVDGSLTLAGEASDTAEIQSILSAANGTWAATITSSDWKSQSDTTDSSFGFEIWSGNDGECHYGVIFIANGHLGIIESVSDGSGNCAYELNTPTNQDYETISNWGALVRTTLLMGRPTTLYLELKWSGSEVSLTIQNASATSGEASYSGSFIPSESLEVRLNADNSETYEIDDLLWYVDSDGDGYYSDTDCDDSDATINPDASEVSDDSIDNDCDGTTDETIEVYYWLDDFEVDNTGDHNFTCGDGVHDFFGCRGVYYEGSNNRVTLAKVSSTQASGYRSLAVNYSVDQSDTGFDYVAAIWEMPDRNYAVNDDFIDMEQFCLWLYDPSASPSYSVPIEFIDSSYNRSTSTTVTVTSSWSQACVDLSGLVDDDWGRAINFTRLHKVALLFYDSYVPSSSSTLYVDDVAFVDTDYPDFTSFGGQGDYELFTKLNRLRGARYFLDLADSTTGLMRDKAGKADQYSIAATGFGMATLAVGVERGLIDQSTAETIIGNALDTLLDNSSTLSTQGFYYHFIDVSSATPSPYTDSEVSIIDTALLVAGALVAGEVFGGDIATDAQTLYENINWNWFLNTTYSYESTDLYQFYMAWKPDIVDDDYEVPNLNSGGGYFTGLEVSGDYNPLTWDWYGDEQTLIAILAAQSSTNAVDGCSLREVMRQAHASNSAINALSWNGSGYTYAFADLFIDFDFLGAETAGVDCDGNAVTNLDFFTNDQAAFAEMANDNTTNQASTYPALGELPYGLSASLGLTPSSGSAWTDYGTYEDWGSSVVAATTPDQDGNATPDGEAMAMIFGNSDPLLNEPLANLGQFYNDHSHAWGIYGFRDAANFDASGNEWFAHDYFGINVGPLVLAMEILDDGQTRTHFTNAIGLSSPPSWW